MSRKRRKINRGERRHKTHTKAITMYDKKLPSLVIIRRIRKRETEGNNLAERTHGWFRFLNQGAQADRCRFLWSRRRRRSSNCKLYINRKWPSRTSNEDHLEGRKMKKKRERDTHTPIQNDTKQTFKDQTIRALCRSLFIIQHPPTFCSTYMQEGRKEGRRGEKREREKQTLVLWRIFGGIGIKNAPT